MERIEHRILREEIEQRRAIFEGALQPLKRVLGDRKSVV